MDKLNVEEMKIKKYAEKLMAILPCKEGASYSSQDFNALCITIRNLAKIDSKESVGALGNFLAECRQFKLRSGITIGSQLQRVVCTAISHSKQPQTEYILIEALMDDETCTAATRAIRDRASSGIIVGTQALEPLIKVLREADFPGQRREAAWALGWLGDTRAEKSLKEALFDTNEEVKEVAAEALKMIGESAASGTNEEQK